MWLVRINNANDEHSMDRYCHPAVLDLTDPVVISAAASVAVYFPVLAASTCMPGERLVTQLHPAFLEGELLHRGYGLQAHKAQCM